MHRPPAPSRSTDHRRSAGRSWVSLGRLGDAVPRHPWDAVLRRAGGAGPRRAGDPAPSREAVGGPAGHRRRPDAEPALFDGPLLDLAAERTGDYDASAASDDPVEVEVGGEAMLQDVQASLAGLGEHLRDLIGRLPGDDQVADVTVDSLDACFAELKRFEGASAALKARLIATASAAKAHRQAGVSDTGAYLRDRLGVSNREAKRQAELSKTLDSMEGAADAVADGRLGVEQAGILGRAARNGHLGNSDEVERDLLDAATSSNPEDLQRTVRKREQQADADALRRDENRAYALRRASMSKEPGGMWTLRAELDPVNGELVSRALRAFTRPDPKGTPPEERRSTEKRTADGLIDMAEAALNGGSAGTSGGVRPHVSVVVMAEQPGAHEGCDDGCHDGADPASDDGDDGSRIDPSKPVPPHSFGVTGSGTVLSPEATARLVCDSSFSRILMAGTSQVLDVGRLSRNWSDPQRRAIVARDGSCRGPGCNRPADWCDIHHIWWWRKGGPSDLANGILLCRYHHRLVHEGGWKVRMDADTARAVFTDLRGKEIATLPRGAPVMLA
jgi:hypothetical protein